jgi:hypothetical protein
MKLSSLVIGMLFGVAVIAGILMISGVSFHRPLTSQGAALYNAANEAQITGVVVSTEEFACPVSEGELEQHFTLRTGDKLLQIHLAQSRILRSNKIQFTPGEQIQIVGAKLRYRGTDGLIAREILRGDETLIFRDTAGQLLMVQ